MVIRAARTDEAQILSNLAVRSKSHWGYAPQFLERCRQHLEINHDYIRDWPVRVLEVEGQVAGFYSLKNIKGENRLDNLWLDLPYIGKGFGKTMLLHSIATAQEMGWERVRLATDEGGKTFYQKFGGKIIGKVKSRLGADIFLTHMEFEF
jgi:N-acetylglutamate synthase-like GNAT family acetyltransferase